MPEGVNFKDKVVEYMMELFAGLLQLAWNQINYIREFDENLKSLETKMNYLSSLNSDIETTVKREEVLSGKRRKREVEIWQNNVKMIENEVNKIKKEKGKQRRWFSLLCRLWSDYYLGERVTKKIKAVDELWEKSSFSSGLTGEPSLESGKILPRTTPLVGATAKNTQNWILACLGDKNTGKIGVYGLEGSGKTTIMKCVHNDLQKTNDFNYSIWVNASKAMDLKTLQSDIARGIELELPEDDYEESRSEKLYNALMRRKKFVLILDGLSKGFPLDMIGIPEPDEENGCKVIVTTRLLSVCQYMETQEEIQVDLLLEDEAWELFKNKVGINVIESSDIHAIAKQVVDECRRLPRAIVTVGQSLRKVENVSVWRNTLNKLKRSSIMDLQEGILL